MAVPPLLWALLGTPEALTPRPGPGSFSTPSQLPCCTPHSPRSLSAPPHLQGFPHPPFALISLSSTPILPPLNLHWLGSLPSLLHPAGTVTSRKRGGRKLGSSQSSVLPRPCMPGCTTVLPTPAPHPPDPYPNGFAPCVPPSFVSVCCPHIPTHPFFDLLRSCQNAIFSHPPGHRPTDSVPSCCLETRSFCTRGYCGHSLPILCTRRQAHQKICHPLRTPLQSTLASKAQPGEDSVPGQGPEHSGVQTAGLRRHLVVILTTRHSWTEGGAQGAGAGGRVVGWGEGLPQ